MSKSKLDKMGFYDLETGTDIPVEAIEEILREERKRRRKELEAKFKNKSITRIELEELMEIKFKNYTIKILYKNFYTVNMKKNRPKGINHSEYGKFIDMLNFLSYDSKIAHRNGREVKRQDLSNYLEFKNIRGFNTFIKKLSKHGMVAESEHGGINFLFINPAYAQRNMKLDSTVFKLFKKELLEFLDDYQVAYLEMGDEDFEISSVIPLQK